MNTICYVNIHLLIFAIHIVYSTRIAFISNTTFIASISGQTLSNMTCTQCTCAALIGSAVGWNCMGINLTCNLIKNYSLTDTGLITKSNSTFFFQQVPLEPLSTTIHPITTTITTPATSIRTTAITTSSIRATSTAHITTTTTTQNPQLDSLQQGSVAEGSWISTTYSYLASTSASHTLTFAFQTGNKYHWYLDDVSVKDSTLSEKMINGDFENALTLIGWTTGPNGSCSPGPGLATSGCHSSSQCYYDSCYSLSTWISQPFSAISGQLYNVSFWFYLNHAGTGNGAGTGTNQLDVTIT